MKNYISYIWVGILSMIIVSNLSFVYGQDTNFHIPKYEKMDGDTLVHHTGYSALYNTNYKVSRWVGYKLKKEHLRVANCENNKIFTSDPSLSQQKDIKISDFKENVFLFGEYEIGHLIKYCHLHYDSLTRKEANYYTNLVLQNSNNNKSLWNQSEKFTERVAEHFKEVYVIIGCIFDSIPDQRDVVVAIPDKFFRILLVKSNNEFHGIAFEIPNEENDYLLLYDLQSSIFEIEKSSKLNFFPMIDEKNQEKIKSGKNSKLLEDFFRYNYKN